MKTKLAVTGREVHGDVCGKDDILSVPPRSLKPIPKAPWGHPDLGFVMMPVEAGSFLMGSENGRSDEKPVRTVQIKWDFWIGMTQVTQALYRKVMRRSPSYFKGDELPVEQVSWFNAIEFCEKLTRRERRAGRLPSGNVYRLPTEAEWEYAARGGSKSRGFIYSGGDDLEKVAWYSANYGSTSNPTHPVGLKAPNELGVYDMSGNVSEWCLDDFHDDYTDAPLDGSRWGGGSGLRRVIRRGGSWTWGTSRHRSTYRSRFWPLGADCLTGFRVVLAPGQ